MDKETTKKRRKYCLAWYNDELDANYYKQKDVGEIINIAKRMEVKANEQELHNLIYNENIVPKKALIILAIRMIIIILFQIIIVTTII